MPPYIDDISARVKNEAVCLEKAFSILAPKSHISSTAVLLKQPSSMQCLEIISRAYGFNSYNGLKADASSIQDDLDLSVFNAQVQKFIDKNNPVNEMDLPSASNFLQNHGQHLINLDHIYSCFRFVQNSQFLSEVKPLNITMLDFWINDYFIFDHSYDFSYKALITGEQNNSYDSFAAVCAEFLIPYIIENINQLQTQRLTNNCVILNIPLSIFYRHKILNNAPVAVSHLDQLIKIFDRAGLTAAKGLTDYQDNHNSCFRLTLSNDVYRQLHMVQAINVELTHDMEQFYSMLKLENIVELPKKPSSEDRSKLRLFQFTFLCLIGITPRNTQAGRVMVSINSPKALVHLRSLHNAVSSKANIAAGLAAVAKHKTAILNFLKFQQDQISLLAGYAEHLALPKNKGKLPFENRFNSQKEVYQNNLEDLISEILKDMPKINN